VIVYLEDARVESKSYECCSDIVNKNGFNKRNEAWHSETVKTCPISGTQPRCWGYKTQNHNFFIHQVSGSKSTTFLICVNSNLYATSKDTAAYLRLVIRFGKELVCALNMHNAAVPEPRHQLRNVLVISPPSITNMSKLRVATALFTGMQDSCSDMSPKFLLSSQFISVVLVPRDRRSKKTGSS
jgi:hypothetical protein